MRNIADKDLTLRVKTIYMKESEYIPLRLETTIEVLSRDDIGRPDKARVIYAAWVSTADDEFKISKFNEQEADDYAGSAAVLLAISGMVRPCAAGKPYSDQEVDNRVERALSELKKMHGIACRVYGYE
jgi:hypothetical protein